MIFTIQTDDEVAGIDIANALSEAGIKHAIVSKQNDDAAQHTGAVDVVCAPRIGVDGKPSNVCVCGRFIVTTTPLT